jgi:hypothetical protein
MAGPVTNLRSLDSANFKTSKRADAVNDLIKSKLGLDHRYEPARLAIAHSLGIPDPAPALSGEDADESGKVIMGKTLFGDEELPIWIAMIVEKAGLTHFTVEDIQEQVRRHWHRGILLLQAEWESCDENYEKFILFLAQRAGLPDHGEPGGAIGAGGSRTPSAGTVAAPVTVRLGDPGTDLTTTQPAVWVLNGKGSPHVAIMGGTGSGKTRLARSMLAQIRRQVNVPTLIFDFKGDLANNNTFAKEMGATVVRSPSNPVPLDVLHLADSSPTEITNAAMRFRESFVRIPKNKIGAVQQDALRDAARAAFLKHRPGKPVEISTVRDELLAIYARTSKKGDIVTSTFNDLLQGGRKMFDPRLSPEEFFGQSWIIDVHEGQETDQRLIVFLVLDALYAYYKPLLDSALDRMGHRALRTVLVVDEARRVLNYSQPSLISLVRETRSKGMSVFLISQSPDDFDTTDEDFLAQIGLMACFRANGSSPRVLKACLGQTVDLAGLPDGVAVTRLPGHATATRIQAWE